MTRQASTRDEIVAELRSIERHLANRVRLLRVIVDEHGRPTGRRYYRGSFQAPPDWQPVTFAHLMTAAKNRSHD